MEFSRRSSNLDQASSPLGTERFIDDFNKGAYVPSISLKKAALQNNLENSFSTEFGDDKNENKGGFNPRTFLDLPSQNTASLAIHNQDVTTIDEMSDSCYLPKGVENIDEKDIHLPNHLSAYVMDIYRYSKWKELQASCMLSENFLSQSKVTPGNRTKLLDWIVNVHRSFKLIPETLHLSCRILDLALAKGTVSNRQLQLYGIASMWIACKMEEIYPPPMSDFLIVTDNAFDEHEMCECERIILQTLKFDVNPPTSLHFLKRAAKVTKSEVLTYVMAKYILELALLDYHLAHFLPSHSAATALYTAYVILNYGKTGVGKSYLNEFWDNNAVFYTGYQESDLLRLGEKFAKIVEKASISKNKNQVFIKYKSETLQSVSLSAECKLALRIFIEYVQKIRQNKVLQKFDEMKINKIF